MEQSLQLAKIKPERPIDSCSISIYFHWPDFRRADLSNKAESVMDLLVDNGILKDDSWVVVGKLELESAGVAKNGAGAHIFINY